MDRAPALILALSIASACTHPRARTPRYGVQPCAPAVAAALLSPDALQCWFDAAHGHWRTLSTESHFDVLVVRAEAFDLRDSEEIARRFVANGSGAFTEILVYVQPERRATAIRRVRWTRDGGLSAFDVPDTR